MTKKRKRKRARSREDQRRTQDFAVLDAYQRHFDSTTQREDAAADLGMDLETFRAHLEHARRMGFDIEARPWRDVPDVARKAWGDAFAATIPMADPPSPCPSCGAHALHRWYSLTRPRQTTSQGIHWQGDGSGWEWCSNCRYYQHFRALVPAWWEPAFDVADGLLHHDPGTLEQARLSAGPLD